MESGGEAGLEITGIMDSLLKTQVGQSENPILLPDLHLHYEILRGAAQLKPVFFSHPFL